MTRIVERVRARLVDNWTSAWRWWSNWMHVVGTTLAGLLLLVPAMPLEVQAMVPLRYRVLAIGVWTLAGFAARLVRQGGQANG
jgi:hypothetical protein